MSDEEQGGFLAIDGPFMRTMELVLNLFLLNVITIICSLPIFTIGSAFCALHHQLYRMSCNREGYVIRDYFKDFKTNFKTATITWLMTLAVGFFLAIDFYLFYEQLVTVHNLVKMGIFSLIVLYLYGLVYLFPVLARYDTTPKKAIQYAFVFAFHGAGILKTPIMLALFILPWIGAMYIANFVLAIFMFGISLPAYINVFFYKPVFEKFEATHEEDALEQEGNDVEME